MINENTLPTDLLRPGHDSSLPRKVEYQRAGHTEAVDLSRLAGLHPSEISEIMNEDGTMSRTNDLFELAEKHEEVHHDQRLD